MTDDVDATADATASADTGRTDTVADAGGNAPGDEPTARSDEPTARSDEATARSDERSPTTDADTSPRADDAPTEVAFEDLSLPQRVFVAALQNPTRGVVVLVLFAFAFSFYIAFWMAFPRVAAFLSAVTVAVVAVLLAVYYVLARVR
ncbi:hypothetical protein [Halorubrum sp. JWXQ-INN 858]|uniref:hypothetical protein n=1 Tax=Halorubrum sp. JWXQ-INN 858 TaxID=2690782 RepID=UPI002AA2ABCF|nr:hypothetical protein [Halorubrum sp. JWXQ-INN 858]